MKLFLIIVTIVFCTISGKLLFNDFVMIDRALQVQIGLKKFCEENKRYPSLEEFKKTFPKISAEKEWYYWIRSDLKSATFQYPMTFPIPGAPGRSKLSEFIPVIYANAVVNPCSL